MGTLNHVGIDKLRLYPSTLSLSLSDLCEARSRNPETTIAHLMVRERSVLPPWEDTVTLAVNAAAGLLSDQERAQTELLIVGTETPVDLEKPVSSWVHRFLDLPSRCRNFDVQHACYSATAALKMALSWLDSPAGRGKRALVIGADASLVGIGEPYEYVLGAGAVALSLSSDPGFCRIDPAAGAVYACEVSDVIRPSRRIETGSSEASLFAYLEAVAGTADAYVERHGATDWARDFAGAVYHAPFAGITLRAHQTLLPDLSRAEARHDFEARSLPASIHHRRVGGLYGGSTFASLLGMVDARPELGPGDRLSVFAFGSGSCAELYPVELGPRVREVADAARATASIDARERIDVPRYEALERARDQAHDEPNHRPEREAWAEHYARMWAGQKRCMLEGVEGWMRSYTWS